MCAFRSKDIRWRTHRSGKRVFPLGLFIVCERFLASFTSKKKNRHGKEGLPLGAFHCSYNGENVERSNSSKSASQPSNLLAPFEKREEKKALRGRIGNRSRWNVQYCAAPRSRHERKLPLLKSSYHTKPPKAAGEQRLAKMSTRWGSRKCQHGGGRENVNTVGLAKMSTRWVKAVW